MFKKLYWRFTAIFLALAVAAVMITAGLIAAGTINRYKKQFVTAMTAVSQSSLPQTIQSILSSQDADDIKAVELEEALLRFGGSMGTNENRTCFVLNAKDAGVIVPTSLRPGSLALTPNLSAAMRAAKGDQISITADYMDYAYFIKAQTQEADGYILYVRDDKTELKALIHTQAAQTLWALLVVMAAAVILGLLLSRSITLPIKRLTRRAEKFARGEFDVSTEKIPGGELGTLVRTFNRMGGVMNKNLNQINSEKHKVEVILEHVNNGIIAFDTGQKVLHINQAAMAMFHIRNWEALRFDDFFEGLHAGVCMAEFLYLERFKSEARDINYEGSHIKAYFVPFKMDDDKAGGVVCVFEDVTEQFNLEEARQKFVAEVSHELKTPLTTIRTYTETLLNGYLDDKKTAAGLLNTVQNETDKMNVLVQNLLILTRFDMQRVDMRKEPVSLDDLLRSLQDMFHIEAENKGLTLTYNRTTDIPMVSVDRDQIERAVKNILSNSIKYCSRGDRIQIFAGCLYNEVYIKIEDSGKGIPKNDLEHVFERFYRVDKARSRDKGGTGLGLPIAKEIIEKHGGSIRIESEFGRFTRVTISLPLTSAE